MRCQHVVPFVPLVMLLFFAISAGGYTTLLNTGPVSNRVDIVFMGDGYTAGQLGTYAQHVNSCLEHLFGEGEDPFPRYRNFFNAYRIDIVSNQSGCDQPDQNIYRDTALGAVFEGSTDRSLVINNALAAPYLRNELLGAGISPEIRLVLVNTTRYGGTGGPIAVYSAANAHADEIALHEIGHSFAGLADEYVEYDSHYGGAEPSEANVTRDSTGQKWSRWFGYVDPLHPGIGAVGVFEGAKYYATGMYRPTYDSKMRNLYQPFNAVSREQIILSIYKSVNPLDAWADNATTVADPLGLWVDTIDPEVIKVQWSIDGVPVTGAVGEELSLSTLGLSIGPHTVTALAYDDTPWVRLETDALEQTVTWQVLINWMLGDTSGDGAINALDIAPFISTLTKTTPFLPQADFDHNRTVNALDIAPFIQVLTRGPNVPGQAVPEPASWAFATAVTLLIRRTTRRP